MSKRAFRVALFTCGLIACSLGLAQCLGSGGEAGPGADAAADAVASDVPAGESVVHDASTESQTPDTKEAAAKDAPETGNSCPDPLYPSRTDGCACLPRDGLCGKDNEGQVCEYHGTCPSEGTRCTCKYFPPGFEDAGGWRFECKSMWCAKPVPCPSMGWCPPADAEPPPSADAPKEGG